MHKVTLAACVAALGLLPAACGSDYRAQNEPPPADAPVIKFSYIDSEDRSLADEFADNYCEAAYDKDAYEIDTDREPGGYQITYACR